MEHHNKILQGDSLALLKEMPDELVDCVITSPPYWALRDYGVDGQLGLEPTFDEFISNLCDVFDEVKRVLKKSGTCFVNLGDTYASTPSGSRGNQEGSDGIYTRLWNRNTRGGQDKKPTHEKKEFGVVKRKSLVGIPFRFALEMISRGWILRNTIIWHKPNAMPASAKDRFTVDFEYVFFFVKSKKYFFERQFVPQSENTHSKGSKLKPPKEGVVGHKDWTKYTLNSKLPYGRNMRCVWNIPTQAFSEAHFAVFPPKFVEPMIKSGSPKDGLVLDPFSGSGTTCFVAKQLGRDYLGLELNSEYADMSRKRLDNRLGVEEGDLREYD